MNGPKFDAARKHFELACFFSRAHAALAADALRVFGDHGSDVSGVVREHFPSAVKDELRQLVRKVTEHTDAGYACRPRGVRTATIICLARSIATKQGAGFYGPQPL